MMSEWEINPPISINPQRDLRRDFTPDAHLEVPFGGHGEQLLGLHVYEWVDGALTEESSRDELTRRMIVKTRAALAAMEASLEPAEPVDFPAEVDPVGALEKASTWTPGGQPK